MKVVLRADIDSVGKKGDICDVADGFARNLLIPKGQALLATPGVMAQAGAMRRARDAKDLKDRESAEVLARSLVAAVVTIPMKAGKEGHLFGSVNAADVASAADSQVGVELDKRKIHLPEPIKTLGTHSVSVKLHSEVQFQLTVEVVAAKK